MQEQATKQGGYYISKIKFRGFKSFKYSEIELPEGFIALVGPNGSGKSNVVDGIRFCLGEMATKSIRVRKAAELINHDSKKAQVSIIGCDKKKQKCFEISRTVYDDGKSEYAIDGKNTTRTNLLEILRKYNFEVGPHNIIAQGQVERIVDMHPKERREIIDQIAGIAEFEEKKKEAIGELNQVEIKISEAKILLAEKESYLKELEKEKESALEYQQKKQEMESARATLIWQEYTKIQNQFDENIKMKASINKEIEKLNTEIEELKKEIEKKEQEKAELSQIVEKLGKKEGLISRIQELNIENAKKETLKKGKEEEKIEVENLIENLEKEKMSLMLKIDTINTQIKQKEEYKKNLEKELEELKKISEGINEEKNIEKVTEKVSELKERLAILNTKKEGIEKLISHDQEILIKMQNDLVELKNREEKTNLIEIKNQIEDINNRLNKLFEQEKKINRDIPEYDKKLLEEKERLATLSASINQNSKNFALDFIKTMKENGKKGIYGTVAELINNEEKFQIAIEAAAGSRLQYVIVENIDLAAELIEKLKKTKSGKCSFIPLDYIQFQKSEKIPQGAYGWLNEFVSYPSSIDKAIRYVFGDTLLVPNIETAKKIGINKYRMVTMEGEVIEKSGVISGGSRTLQIMAQIKVKKLQEEVEKIKEIRDELYGQLYKIREQSQELRKERISLELKVRELEAELGTEKERERRIEQIKQEMNIYNNNIRKNQDELEKIKKELELTRNEIKLTLENLEKIKESEEKLKEEKKRQNKEKEEKYQKILEKHSALITEIETAKNEIKIYLEQIEKIKQEIEDNKNKKERINESIEEYGKELKTIKKEIEEIEQRINEFSKRIQKEYQKIQQIDEEIKKIAIIEGQKKYELDGLQRRLQELEVKNASVQTKLVDLKSEYEKYISVKLLEDVPKSKLEEIVQNAEKRINELGMVNLKAPEMYEEKKLDFEQLQEKIGRLEKEKEAVMTLIKEIETKKIKVFMETFDEVNKHFKKLFSMVFKGEGTLYLEDESNIFESGLNIKIKEEGKKKEKYLESLSGGEKSLLALMFIFALEMKKPASFYILDEADASLDKENTLKMSDFISQMSKTSQFIVITHNDTVVSSADVVLGVTKDKEGSKIIGVKLAEIEQQITTK
ncbi:MAG: AAA family ATPase [Candidatus Anstonellaceae archaeon]